MTNSPRHGGRRKAMQRIVGVRSGRTFVIILFAALVLMNWAAAVWLLQYTYHEHEASVLQSVTQEARYYAQKISLQFEMADRTLLDFRARYRPENLKPALEMWTNAQVSEGIAAIAPDGHVVAMSPHSNTAGWPRLMARLANSPDVLAVGEPTPGRDGHIDVVPIARRITLADGSFGGILMYTFEVDSLLNLSANDAALDGCITMTSDDGIILARNPDVPGILGMRVDPPGGVDPDRNKTAGSGRMISPVDGVDRVYAFHTLEGLPVRLAVAIGYDAAFAGWKTLLWAVIAARIAGTVLILLVAGFWYKGLRKAKISTEALSTILSNIEQGVRVENADGRVIAANEAGAALQLPEGTTKRVEQRGQDGAIIQIARYDLADDGAVLIGTDITTRHTAEARIQFLAHNDKLTGLPDRWSAAAIIQDLIASRSDAQRMAALILFDLDGFRDINDSIGHEGGDTVLNEVAVRLRELVSDSDVVARLGGDEFLIFLDDPENEASVMSLARMIPRALARPIEVADQQLHLGASLGIALFPRDGGDAAALFRHAGVALSRAKLAGRGTAQRFDAEMMESFEQNRMIESDLRRALEHNELEIRLQPQFAATTLEVTGFEALARWHHPERGDVSPALFIPVAERSGLINPLGLWAIEQSCRTAVAWRSRYRIAVNLSPLQLRCETLQEDIRAILRRTQFPAHLLELEVTESVLLDKDERILETLHKLRAMDIRITLDDFGTGYSSLSYLRRFPFDKIKIDKSFIQGQSADHGTRVILEAMIRMCTDLGFDVVAEGVETEQQLTELRQLGCREIQGFLLGRPMKAELVEEFLIGHRSRFSIGDPVVASPG